MHCRIALFVAGLALGTLGAAQAQHSQPIAATRAARFETWRPTSEASSGGKTMVERLSLAPKNRTRRALLGGALGAAAGVIGCTVISTLANDSADGGLSFCPLDTNLLFGGGGFLLGAAVGYVI
jgi:hypothetical protein